MAQQALSHGTERGFNLLINRRYFALNNRILKGMNLENKGLRVI